MSPPIGCHHLTILIDFPKYFFGNITREKRIFRCFFFSCEIALHQTNNDALNIHSKLRLIGLRLGRVLNNLPNKLDCYPSGGDNG